MKNKITAIILTYNNSAMIEACLNSLTWCDEVLLIDHNSTDQTTQKAEALGAKVINFSHPSFARRRNEAIKYAKGSWLFYIDADERVTPTLAKEIMVHAETASAAALSFRRKNYLYGKLFISGGWQNDWVTRVFQKTTFKQWRGAIHESPIFEGEAIRLSSPLLHFTHRSTEENLRKSANWTKMEAELLFKAGVPPVKFLTLVRKGSMEFFRRALIGKGYRDGLAGLIEALVQGMNRVLVYIQVWELQQKPSLPEIYQQEDEKLKSWWQNEKK
ncbi:MAG TPA: glycosyltransferase family 2 protein [Patescibacteria group bacterium]|jgi:glycosyltransferase involved in cell wall biosynthesis